MKYSITENNVKYVGRTYLRENVLWCALSGSGIEFVVDNAADVAIKIIGDDKAQVVEKNENCSRIGLLVNGEVKYTFMLTAREYTLEFSVEKGDTVQIIKLSESAMSTFGIAEIETEAGVKPADKKEKFIEIIGDSITCGYGVEDEDETHSFKTETENVMKSYSYKTAKKLGYDYSMVCYSGYGIYSGYTGEPEKINDFETLPKHYEKLGYSIGTSGVGDDKFKMTDIVWEFKRQPDVIVINLGTNDQSYCKTPIKADTYRGLYYEFLKKVRKYNSSAPILCILGAMGDDLFTKMCEAVEIYSEETGDKEVYTLHLDAIIPETEKYAADYHPTEKTHERVSEVVVSKIKEILA